MESLNLIKNDPWLAPYEAAIEGRYQYVIDKEKSLTISRTKLLSTSISCFLTVPGLVNLTPYSV